MLRVRYMVAAAALLSAVVALLPLAPITPSVSAAPAAINLASNAKLGNILTDANGMTLYMFMNDKAGQSTCTGGCAQTWPALTVNQGEQPSVASGVTGQVNIIQRPDGALQVVYLNQPLYRYAPDQKPGDVKGQGIGGVWFAATPTGPAKMTSAKGSQYGAPSGYQSGNSYGMSNGYGNYGGMSYGGNGYGNYGGMSYGYGNGGCQPYGGYANNYGYGNNYGGYGMSYSYVMPYRMNYGYAPIRRFAPAYSRMPFYGGMGMMRRY
jgi:predicted lipoprotein with Yx(FWY)xxD motif